MAEKKEGREREGGRGGKGEEKKTANECGGGVGGGEGLEGWGEQGKKK